MGVGYGSNVGENWERVRERIEAAKRRAGRLTESITVVAVSKTVPAEAILAAYQVGLRHFGENRVEEAEEKIPRVNRLLGGDDAMPDITWHLVGHLQRRKVPRVIGLFAMIHSVDSVRLAQRLSRFCTESGVIMPILLEMNVSGEISKYGFSADRYADDPMQRDVIYKAVEEILGLPGIRVCGVMTIAPIVPEQEAARPYFQALRHLRDDLATHFPEGEWGHLSMGMTDDFEVAVEEGATLLRIGRAIFGSR